MKSRRMYDGVVGTGVQLMEVVFGELMWGMARGALYSAEFLGVMVTMGLTGLGWAVAAFPATLLVGFAFGGLGMALSPLIRSWQGFDIMGTVQFALFLFSRTLAPVSPYPPPRRLALEATPPY